VQLLGRRLLKLLHGLLQTGHGVSRAFVKEAENETAELPDRPISPHRNFVTEAGLAAVEAALGRFEAAHRAATDKGDASSFEKLRVRFTP
jgi:hypothetical protein